MPLQFDATRYLSLVEAFERTGQAMFPEDWCGLEAWTAPVGGPAAIAAEREAILGRQAPIWEQLSKHRARLRSGTPQGELGDLQARILMLEAEDRELSQRLEELPFVEAADIEDEERFERRRVVEAKLRDAFQLGVLRLLHGPFQIVDWSGWCRSAGFKVNFRLGVIRAPVQVSARRWTPGHVERATFEEWIEKRAKEAWTGKEKLTPEAWVARYVELSIGSPPKRSTFIYELQQAFPELSARKALRLWAGTPAFWRRPGPKKR